MAKSLRKRRDITNVSLEDDESLNDTISSSFNDPSNDVELYSKEVLDSLLKDNLPPTPNNFSLYFDRLLEDKSDTLRKQIKAILQLEETNNDEATIELERTLKHGFVSVKSILSVSAGLYKNMTLMTKILAKRKDEISQNKDSKNVLSVISSLETDLGKLDEILKKQISNLKSLYDHTATIVKNVENETIFDNKYGIYNKRYLLNKVEQEIQLIKEFKHKSTIIMIELSNELVKEIINEKALMLMTRTIARLLMKTSRRSDTVAHYGNGVFSMLLKHTDIDSAIKAAQRLSELVQNSNFFLADKEIELKVSIGITPILHTSTTDEIIVNALKAMETAYKDPTITYIVLNDQ
ncbi:GGDEF domain-containing protein [Sulfurimonas sp. HSL-1716]|uniref:GGDEF domain-containing protein n=1 Tax=Hydrocurvibacter sulfurireducens TaxID=3131937 RepID=UPI0031F93D95